MDIVINPLFSWLTILPVILVCLALVTWVEQTILSRLLFGGLVLALGLLALRPALVTEAAIAPDEPVRLIFENNAESIRTGIETRTDQLARRLELELDGARVDTAPLDGRWPSAPVFRDYERLSDPVPAEETLRIRIGDGLHTRARGLPGAGESPRVPRARLDTGGSADTTVASLTVSEPVVDLSGEESGRWQLILNHADRLESAIIQLRDGEDVLTRRTVGQRDRQRVSIETPNRPRGQWSFAVELLTEGDTRLPAGHPRRSEVGMTVERQHQPITVASEHPGWTSGWWGRTVRGFQTWTPRYRFFASEQLPGGDPAVMVIRGTPSPVDRRRVQDVVADGTPLLWLVDPASDTNPTSWWPTGESVEWSNYKGSFQPSLTDRASAIAPALSGYENTLTAAPPFETLHVPQTIPDGFETVMTAGEHPLLMVDDSRRIAVLTAPDVHRWSMRWGQLGRPGFAAEWARELLGVLLRMRPQGPGRHLGTRWVRAGEPVAVRRTSDSATLTVQGPDGRAENRTLDRGQLAFHRPGTWSVVHSTAGDTEWEETIIVVEPEQERIPGRGVRVQNPIPDQRVFSDSAPLLDWARSRWDEQTRIRERQRLGWDHFVVLTLLVGLLAGGWLARDRGGIPS